MDKKDSYVISSGIIANGNFYHSMFRMNLLAYLAFAWSRAMRSPNINRVSIHNTISLFILCCSPVLVLVESTVSVEILKLKSVDGDYLYSR